MSKKKMYECKYCNYITERKNDYNKHLKTNKHEEMRKLYLKSSGGDIINQDTKKSESDENINENNIPDDSYKLNTKIKDIPQYSSWENYDTSNSNSSNFEHNCSNRNYNILINKKIKLNFLDNQGTINDYSEKSNSKSKTDLNDQVNDKATNLELSSSLLRQKFGTSNNYILLTDLNYLSDININIKTKPFINTLTKSKANSCNLILNSILKPENSASKILNLASNFEINKSFINKSIQAINQNLLDNKDLSNINNIISNFNQTKNKKESLSTDISIFKMNSRFIRQDYDYSGFELVL